MNKFQFILMYVFSALLFVYDKGYCKTKYFRFERPKVLFYDHDLLGNLTVTSRRMSRNNPIHYVNITFYLRKTVTNEYMHNIYFYQLLSNTYRRSFVELHFYGCDFFMKKNMFSDFLIPAYYRLPASERPFPIFKCPVTPGYYRFEMLTIMAQNVPENFPFSEGRMYYNFTEKMYYLLQAAWTFSYVY